MTDLTVDSRVNCFELPDNTWENLEMISESITLKPGTYVIRIKPGTFSFWSSGDKKEPFVMLWFHGGRFTNLATEVETSATLESLNGYNDTVTVRVRKDTNLYAFFLDSICADNRGKIVVSILHA